MAQLTEKEIRKLETDGFIVIDEPTVYASISKLAEVTGKDRRTVSDRLHEAGVTGRAGPSNAKLYPTLVALPALCTERLGWR